MTAIFKIIKLVLPTDQANKMETPEEVIKHECGKCGKCETRHPDEENSYHGGWCCEIEFCEDCDCDCDDEDEEELECAKCGKGMNYDDCVHISEDEYLCSTCGKGMEDVCIECYKIPCVCEDEILEEEEECTCNDSEDEDEEEEDDDEWAACYGAKTVKSREYIMAGGGSHWWNYVVEFDQHGEQVFVYIENKDGKHQQFRQKLAYRIKDGVEQMRLVGKDWEPDVLQEEGLVFYCE